MSSSDPSLPEALRRTLNAYCVENRTDTPDFILAEFLLDALSAFEQALRARDGWYGHHCEPGRCDHTRSFPRSPGVS